MLVFIFCSLLLLVPALQGVWDLRTQFMFEAAVFLTGGFWIFREIMSGRPPAFLSDKRNIPLLCAAAFSYAAFRLSPVSSLIAPEWWNLLTGMFVLVFASSLTLAERKSADLALRLAAWCVVLLSFYQGYMIVVKGVGGAADLTASLPTANALALFTLMLIPLAVVWRDILLLAALLIVLIWTMSVPAVLGLLAGACFYAADNISRGEVKKNRLVLAVLAVAAAAAVSLLEPRFVSDRLSWWDPAFRMFSDRPLLGFGQGAFAHVYPAFYHSGPALPAAAGAHNYYLEFLAENGLFAFLFCGWAALVRLKGIKGLEKYALISALVYSFTDFGLAAPANFFIFCYLLSVSRPGEAAAAAPALRPDKKTAAVLAALGLACFAVLCGSFSSQFKLSRLRGRALSDLYAGTYQRAEAVLAEAARLAPADPLVPGLLGRVRLRAGSEQNDTGLLFSAAVELERSVTLVPYNAGAWLDLERLYAAAGERRLLEGLQQRKAEVYK